MGLIGYAFLAIVILVVIILVIHFNSPEDKGKRSEQAIASKLNKNSFFNKDSKTLMNIYVPKESGGTSEIDVLYVTHKGLIVLENKNYAGYIFGNEANKNWTVTLYAGKTWFGNNRVEKYPFYNPVWQNRTHIKNLKAFLNTDVKVFSIITFSDRGELKDITVDSTDVYVCNHSGISQVLKNIWERNPDVLTTEQIEYIYNTLVPLVSSDDAIKQKHISDIQDRFDSMTVCPVCGGKLILRTAQKGPYLGNQFYGCSNYPKCKYIKNL